MSETSTPTLTLSYARGETDTPLIEQTIGDNLDDTVLRFPDREALVDVAQGRRWTYTEFRDDVDRLARALLAVEVRTGDRVGIWAPNCFEWTLTQFATAKVGAILVNINPSYRAHELEYVLKQSGISMLVAAESFKSSNYKEMIEEVRPEVPGLKRVVLIGTTDWEELLAHADEISAEELASIQLSLAPNDPINIQYTSGTTGFPPSAESEALGAPDAARAAGVTPRQLDYWARTGVLRPSIGSPGSRSRHSLRDILVLKVIKRLLDAGVSLQQIRIAVAHLQERALEDLAQITSSATVLRCTSAPPPTRSSTSCKAGKASSASP